MKFRHAKKCLTLCFACLASHKERTSNSFVHSIMVHAECLPTEIWLEIFSYLASHDNTKAFSNLNRFFDRFVSTKYFGIDHRLTKNEFKSKPWERDFKNVRFETIRSLTPGRRNPNFLIQFLSRYSNKLIHLRKLSIYLRQERMEYSMIHLIEAFKRLPLLESLEIRSTIQLFADSRMKDLLITIFSESLALRHCQLLFTFEILNLRSIEWSGYSSIQHLTLGKISWTNLLSILSQVPNLITLRVSMITSHIEPSTLILPSLRKLVLSIGETPFIFLTEICRLAPHLNVLFVTGEFLIGDDNYFQENSWKKLLDQIRTYEILLTKSFWEHNKKERLKQIEASLGQKPWLKLAFVSYNLCATIHFRST